MTWLIVGLVLLVVAILFFGLPALQQYGFRGNREKLAQRAASDLAYAEKIVRVSRDEYASGTANLDSFKARGKQIVDLKMGVGAYASELVMATLPETHEWNAAFNRLRDEMFELTLRLDDQMTGGELRRQWQEARSATANHDDSAGARYPFEAKH